MVEYMESGVKELADKKGSGPFFRSQMLNNLFPFQKYAFVHWRDLKHDKQYFLQLFEVVGTFNVYIMSKVERKGT